MIVLKIKNKHQLSLEALIEEAKKKDGVPDHFDMDPSDYAGFLIEIRKPGTVIGNHVKVITPDTTEECFSLNSQIKSDGKYSEDELYNLVDKWSKNEYSIEYKGIPIKRTRPKKVIKKKEQDQ